MLRSRREDWAERLLDIVAYHQGHAFAWGRFDCATLYGDCIWALTGEDPLRTFRGWQSEIGAARALLQSGAPDVPAWVATHLPQVPAAKAGRGDFGYVAGPRHRLQFPAVIVGAEAHSRNEAGWVTFPRQLITEAFSIR